MAMSASTPIHHLRRFKHVYVEIPPSPLHSFHSSSLVNSPHVLNTSTSLKENLRPLHGTITQQSLTSTSLKRKLSDHDDSSPNVEVSISSNKKPKSTSMSRVHTGATDKGQQLKDSEINRISATTNASIDYPNGFFYCHRCSRKRDIGVSIQCTFNESCGTAKERRCPKKFCQSCLKNRYSEDVDVIKANGSGKMKGHVDGAGYIYKCPKCRNICNCARCRKSKGLKPTVNAVRKVGAGSAAKFLSDDPKVVAVVSCEGIQPETPKKKAQTKKEATGSIVNPNALTPALKVKFNKSAPKSESNLLPVLRWTSVSSNLSLSQAEERFQIREFVLRFAPVMNPAITKLHLKELDDIGGREKGHDGEDESMTGWVSETCVKSILIGLLGLLVNIGSGDTQKNIRNAIKDIRLGGANLNKIWVILASLRDPIGISDSYSDGTMDFSSSKSFLRFPDPLPAPSHATVHNTRKMRSSGGSSRGIGASVYVTNSAQMVPVLLALINMTLGTEKIRQEIERGLKEGRELVRKSKEGCRNENERWERERKEIESTVATKDKDKETKLKRESHKQYLQDIDHALKLAMHGYAPRFGPLGRDDRGRVYWALSPGVIERENALNVISSSAGDSGDGDWDDKTSRKGSRSRRQRAKGKEERSCMKEWSWFVAVWGVNPSLGLGMEKAMKSSKDENDSSENNENVEKWWGIWEHEEIRRAAISIAIRSGLGPGDEHSDDASLPSDKSAQILPRSTNQDVDWVRDGDVTIMTTQSPFRDELKLLVKGLNEYAAALEWRVRREAICATSRQEHINSNEDEPQPAACSSGKGRTVAVVSAEKFYN